jgi:DNA-directed RNA polymerase
MTVNAAVVEVLAKLTPEQADEAAGINAKPYDRKKDEEMEDYERRLRKQRSSIREKRKLFSSTLEAAKEAMQFEAIYFPHYFCFRGRVYSVDQGGLGPQGTKVGRSLLMPAGEGKVVGMTALFHELGNSWGYDKDLIDTKIEKAKSLPYAAIAAEPLANTEWLATDEPAKALACCIEIAAAEASPDPESYVSRLFVAFDGTNNGLQHLALLTRDADAAAATNVTSAPFVRRDIYLEVAQAAAAKLSNETITNHPDLRKLAKTPVMTQSYGVTAKGMLDQIAKANEETGSLLSDDEVKELRDGIQSSIRESMPAPMAFADWIADVTRLVAESGVAPAWMTPSGSYIAPGKHKNYSTYGKQSVVLCGRKTTLPNFAKPQGVNVGKHVSGSIANMIHSLDADALHMTVCKLLEEGVKDILMVHDSYAVMSGDADVLARVLREVHAEMYTADVLESLFLGFQQQTDVVLPRPPAMGDLDVADVLTSPYFFS